MEYLNNGKNVDGKGIFNIRSFGAIGDGETLDTIAIQSAIDACVQAGGGMVLVPPGKFLTGTLWLKSHVELHLLAGAEIYGSPDRHVYNPDDAYPENGVFSSDKASGAHLIVAYKAVNAAITGHGVINGNSSAFFESLPPDQLQDNYRLQMFKDFPIRDWRPGQMITFCLSVGIRITDVKLINSPYWALFCHGCDDVAIRGLSITSHPQTANGDGIDIDLCRNVTISDCRIASGDDSITIRASNRLMQDRLFCENVAVTNCILSSPCNAVRIGVGNGNIRNINFSNLVIVDTYCAICFVTRYSEPSRGTSIEDVHFSNLRINAVHALRIPKRHPYQSPAGVRRVSFAHINAQCDAGSCVEGCESAPLDDLLFANCTFTMRRNTDVGKFIDAVRSGTLSGHFWRGGFNKALFLQTAALSFMNSRGVTLSNFRLFWDDKPHLAWHEGLFFADVDGIQLQGCVLASPNQGDGAAIGCARVHNMTVDGCLVNRETPIFIRHDRQSNAPALFGNHLAKVGSITKTIAED